MSACVDIGLQAVNSSLVTFRRKNDRLSRFDPAGAATERCKIVQFPALKHFG
jgi:hypothetical protein